MTKCVKCGAEIPDGRMHCPECGFEVRMVPDYNPMDEVLAGQIGGAVPGPDNRRRSARPDPQQEARRRRNKKKAQMARKRKRRRAALLMFLMLLILAFAVGFVIYRSSYTGLVHRGQNAFNKDMYDEALGLFNKAIKKAPSKAPAYRGYYQAMMALGDEETAEKKLLEVVGEYPDQVDLYKVLFQFYIDCDTSYEIANVLETIEDESVRKKLAAYDVEQPEASLEEGDYDDVQQVSLSADDAKAIYYTVDGTDPSKTSKKYDGPIQLSEGETVLQAIAVNDKGIESLIKSFTYNIELPVADAPAVTPSTGQYSGSQMITVTVPEGYTCYYTTDGSEPSAASQTYSGPIEMPKGNTIFSFVLESPDGKLSDITKRNYERL